MMLDILLLIGIFVIFEVILFFARGKWFCKYLGWHVAGEPPHYKNIDPLHFQTYAKCKHCGKECMIDSQGNLF
jgi:hypothetical protein